MKRCVGLSLILVAPAAASVLNITEDTYLDNQVVGSTDAKKINFGGNPAVKAVSNGVNASLTHALFKLPQGFWDAIGTGPLTSPVTVTYNIRNNSLASTAAVGPTEAANNNFRQLELHPLTQAFTAGTGGSGDPTNTSAGDINGTVVNGTPTYYGADWNTANGITPWATTPGGSFDGNFSTLTHPLITAKAQTIATWDITGMLNNAVARAELQNFGLFVRTTDESVLTKNEFASMVSAESGANPTGGFFGQGPTVNFNVPEPTGLALVGGVLALGLRRRRIA